MLEEIFCLNDYCVAGSTSSLTLLNPACRKLPTTNSSRSIILQKQEEKEREELFLASFCQKRIYKINKGVKLFLKSHKWLFNLFNFMRDPGFNIIQAPTENNCKLLIAQVRFYKLSEWMPYGQSVVWTIFANNI